MSHLGSSSNNEPTRAAGQGPAQLFLPLPTKESRNIGSRSGRRRPEVVVRQVDVNEVGSCLSLERYNESLGSSGSEQRARAVLKE